jgi:hypothetical protein
LNFSFACIFSVDHAASKKGSFVFGPSSFEDVYTLTIHHHPKSAPDVLYKMISSLSRKSLIASASPGFGLLVGGLFFIDLAFRYRNCTPLPSGSLFVLHENICYDLRSSMGEYVQLI